MATKKLRGGPIITLDDQIIRWREKLRRENKAIGRHTDKEKGRSKKYRAEKADDELVASGRKKFFE